jgi:Zn-dependent peptidase ImmA (M78 family)
LYNISADELLDMISSRLKNPISKEDIFSSKIKLSHLKRIDKVFNKGLHYYLDPKIIEISEEASIFFRKEKFKSYLNIGAKKIVTYFEEFKISLSAISKLAEIKIERILPVYSVKDDAKIVAQDIRNDLYPSFTYNIKDFLKLLIGKFAEKNILVFEFVETWNKKEKVNIDGFFLNPNVIVLKRQQNSLRREIFTLIHELGHYLLNEEEIESIDDQIIAQKNLSLIERWCNDFAYYFLMGNYDSTLNNLEKANPNNDYHFDLIGTLSKQTHLSKLALYTRLLYQRKISKNDYEIIKQDEIEKFNKKKEEEKRIREIEKEMGIRQRGSTPKPINSPLLISTIQIAFNEGIINEYEVCKKLNIKPDKLDKYIQ